MGGSGRSMEMELAGIRKSYKKKKVLRNISLSTKRGSCVGILGGNGSGKSTLLSILAGVQKADGGSFLYQGEDLLQNSSRIPSVLGYVPQGNPLIEELNAWDNLRMWYDRATLLRELEQGALAMLGIGNFLKTPVHKMSGGMKKRLSIGCAVVARPKILVLDEPSAALDLICKENIYCYLEQYKAEGGIVLLATHDMQELELCEQCYILKEGVLESYQYDGDLHHLAGKL